MEKHNQEFSVLIGNQCRVALFDCDGTLWARDSAKEFFYWLIENGMLSAPIAAQAGRFATQFDAGMSEPKICRQMCRITQGLFADEVELKAKEFFRTRIAPTIYPEVRDFIACLARRGCDIWAISSSPEWLIQTASEYLCIEKAKIIGSKLRVRQGRFTKRLDLLPTGMSKARVAHTLIGRDADIAFGNTIHDRFLLELAHVPVAVNPTIELRLLARTRGWQIMQFSSAG
jgi:HAD superfamily phosphoserine phosphatase-like hydrolase